MATKKPVKKVEIADDTVLNLKEKAKLEGAGEAIPVSFNVRKIEEDVYRRPDFGVSSNSQAEVEKISDRTVDERMMDRVPRGPLIAAEVPVNPKFDQEALHKRMENFAEKLEKAVIKVAPAEGHNFPPNVAAEPKDLIKVKFEKFVQLVATKDFLSILEKNKNEDVVISSNLLTELASAVEEKGEKKSPVIFIVGLAIGVIITYLLLNHH